MSESADLARSLRRNLAGERVAVHLPLEGATAALTAAQAARAPNPRFNSILAHNSYHTAEILTVRHMQGWWLEAT
jgi:hypothetical protein